MEIWRAGSFMLFWYLYNCYQGQLAFSLFLSCSKGMHAENSKEQN